MAQEAAEQYADAPGAIGAIGAGIAAIAWLGGGRLDLARERLDYAARVLSLGVTSASLRGRFAIHHVETLAKLGETEQAAAHAEGVYGSRHSAHLLLEPDRMFAQAWVAANRGARSDAVRIAHRAADYARTQGQLAREVFSLQAATHFGDATTAGATRKARRVGEWASGDRSGRVRARNGRGRRRPITFGVRTIRGDGRFVRRGRRISACRGDVPTARFAWLRDNRDG